jgi:hypothetical protein
MRNKRNGTGVCIQEIPAFGPFAIIAITTNSVPTILIGSIATGWTNISFADWGPWETKSLSTLSTRDALLAFSQRREFSRQRWTK